MKVNKLLKNKFYKKLCYIKLNIIEFGWDLIYKIPVIGDYIIQDFYPFPQHGRRPRFMWYHPITRPISFWSNCYLSMNISDWWRWSVEPKLEKLRYCLIGKNQTKLMKWFYNKNDSKLLTANGFFSYIRTRDQDTKYYSLKMLPGGYTQLHVSRFIEEGSETGTNMYMQMIMAMSDDYEEPKIKEEKKLLYRGFIWRKRDLFKFCRAFCLSYFGTRWHEYCTRDWRNFMRAE